MMLDDVYGSDEDQEQESELRTEERPSLEWDEIEAQTWDEIETQMILAGEVRGTRRAADWLL